MFWDRVAGFYDLFVESFNHSTHSKLKKKLMEWTMPEDIFDFR